MKLSERITVDPEQCGGRPCVRGMRIRVTDVLDLFAAGLSAEQILEENPDLEAEDLQACLQFARPAYSSPLVDWIIPLWSDEALAGRAPVSRTGGVDSATVR